MTLRKKMNCRISATFLFLLMIVAPYQAMFTDEITEEDAERIYNCAGAVLCNTTTFAEFVPVLSMPGPKSEVVMYEWFEKIYKVSYEKDPMEYMAKFSRTVCSYTAEQRKKYIKDLILKLVQYQEETCVTNPDPIECQTMQEASLGFEEVIQRNELNGVCKKNEVDMMKTMAAKVPTKMPIKMLG